MIKDMLLKTLIILSPTLIVCAIFIILTVRWNNEIDRIAILPIILTYIASLAALVFNKKLKKKLFD